MKPIHRFSVIALAGAALALSSCATPGGRSPSGFLTQFSQLDAGYGTTDAVSAYLKPGVNLKKYDRVMIDPVTTVVATPAINPQIPAQLAAYLGQALRSEVSGKLALVTTPGPTTLRVRCALTDMLEKPSGHAAVTIVQPNPQVTMTGKLGSAATASFVSKISFEGEILDSVTGERLWALCDHRLGAKREATATTTWAAVRSGTQQRAARLYQRILAIRAR